MKLLSFVVPCYNSQEYMRHCIDTLLAGGEKVEILIKICYAISQQIIAGGTL